MTDVAQPFDPAEDAHVGLWDELPLWSAMAGLLLLDHVPLDARRVLDLGCGSGFPALELAERLGSGARVTGIDPWGPAIRRANAKRRLWPVRHVDLVRGEAARLPFRDDGFDLIVSNLGINNFADAETAFGECRRVLAPGGTVAIATNLFGHFAEVYAAFADVVASDPAAAARLRTHVEHRPTIDGLTRTLARHGLEVTDVHERAQRMRFRDGSAVLEHHFMRLGFVPAWEEVVGGSEHLGPLRAALDRRARGAGGLELTVPLAVVIARA